MQPIHATLHVWRNCDPWQETISGIALDGAPVDFGSGGPGAHGSIRLYPGAPAQLAPITLAGGLGSITLSLPQSVIAQLPAAPYGADLILAWDIVVKRAGVESPWFAGSLVLHYGVTPTGLSS